MDTGAPGRSSSHPPGRSLDWRWRSLRALYRLLVYIVPPFLLLGSVSSAPLTWTNPYLALAAAYVVFIWGAFGRWRYGVAVMALLVSVFAVTTLGLLHVGFSPGAAATMMVVVLATGVLVHERAAWIAAVTVFAAYAGVGYLYSTGAMENPATHVLDVLSFKVWLQVGLTQLLISGFAAFLLGTLVRRLERSVLDTSVALDALRREHRERQRAQRERRKFEGALAESQRLEALGRLAGGVAHDFNNSLVVILGWAEVLRTGNASSEEVQEAATAIASATERSAALTRQLLAIGRRDTRVAVPTDVSRLVQQVASTLRRVLPASIEVKAFANEPTVAMVDPAQLDQMLLNLALNAKDAMPSGGILEIEVEPAPNEDTTDLGAQEFVVIRVRDSGVGMDSATLERVFEPFFTTKDPGSGSGLGLASAYAIARSNGGKLTVQSTPGMGTTFSVYLPRTNAPATRGTDSLRLEQGPPSSQTLRYRLLLVEDEPAVRRVTRRSLVTSGFDVLDAADAESAIEVLKAEPSIDILITDAVLPGIGSSVLLEFFRARYPDAPVLVCSGHVQEELLRLGIETGQYSYLQKPFAPRTLVAEVQRLLAKKRRSARDGATA